MTRRRDFVLAVGPGAALSAQSSPAGSSQPKKTVRLGLIGCGNRGSYLAQTSARLGSQGDDVEVAAVCDIYQPRLERVATRLKAKEYKEARDLVRDPNVDAVIVATPDRLHPDHALEAVRAGKDVYCEKPITHWQQFDKLKELVQAVRQRKTVFQMGAQRLSDPVWRQAAQLIQRKEIGKAVHAQMGYFRLGDSGERGMPVDDPNARPGVGLDWDAFQGDAPKRPFSVSRFFQWRMYLDYSGGPGTDNNVHFLALIVKALGVKFPAKVVSLGGKYLFNGEREVPDTFDTIVQYPGGTNLTFLGTYCNDKGVDTVIRGTEGTLTLIEAGLISEPLAGVKKPRREVPHLDYAQEHLRDFFRCVRTREKPQGDIELAYYTQTLLIMSMRSYMEGKVAVFDPDAEEIRMS